MFPLNLLVSLLLILRPSRECLLGLVPHSKIGSLGVYDWVDLYDIRFPVCLTRLVNMDLHDFADVQ